MLTLSQSGPLPKGQQGEWNIYDESGPMLVPFDTFFGYGFGQENKVAEKPVEKGKFVNYNKTIAAKRVSVRLGKSGNPSELTSYLDAIDKLVAGTDLVSVVTPEKTYLDVNAVRYDFDRGTESGADRIIVELSFQEIAQVEAQYSDESLPQEKVRKPQDASTVDRGKQQVQNVSASEDKSALYKIGEGLGVIKEEPGK